MPAIAKKGILYTEVPSVENRVVEGNQNPVTSGAVYKELGDTSVNNDLGANVSNQIGNLHTQMQTKVVKEFKTLTTNANAEILFNGTKLTSNDYDIIIPLSNNDASTGTMSTGLFINKTWALWNNSGYLSNHGEFSALCIKFS